MANELKKFYVTFGQAHAHAVAGKTFDRNCVCEIEAEDYGSARAKAFEAFGPVWAFMYEDLEKVKMEYFPRGLIKL